MLVIDANSSIMQWPHVPTTTVPGWQGEAFTHNKQVDKNESTIVVIMLENLSGSAMPSPITIVTQVGAPLAPPTSCLKVRHMFDAQHQVPFNVFGIMLQPKVYETGHPREIDCQMQLSLRFNFPIPVPWLGEWSKGRDSAEVSWFYPIIPFNYPIYPIILFKQTNSPASDRPY